MRADRPLVGILLLSLLLKLGLAFFAERNAPILDERAYLQLAQGLAESGRYDGTFRPPLYPAFEALFLVTGLGTLGIRIAQALLSTFSVLQVHRLALRVADPPSARLAAFLVAFDPVLIAFSHRLWSETLFLVLFLGFLDAALAAFSEAGASSRFTKAAETGVWFGAAALARPVVLALAPLLLLAPFLQWCRWWRAGAADLRRGGTRVAIGLGVAALLILPWTLRNWSTAGALVLIDSNGPFNFLVGAEPQARYVVKDDRWDPRFGSIDGVEYVDLVARDARRAQQQAMHRAVAHVRADPAGFAAKSAWEAGHLWTLDSFLLRHLRNGWYGRVPHVLVALATLAASGWFALLALGGLGAIALGATTRSYRAIALPVGIGFTLVFGVTYALSRYAVPLHPLLAIAAATLLARPRELWRSHREKPGRGARSALLALLVAALLACWWRDLPLLRDMLATGGKGHLFQLAERRRRRRSSAGATKRARSRA